MENINRRNWLRLAGIAGAATVFQPLKAGAVTDLHGSLFASADESPIAKLSFNENPFAPSKKVQEALKQAFSEACRYPFMKIAELERLIAEKEGLMPEQVIITGGSTEGLKAAGLTFGVHGGEIISPDPTYQSLLSYASQFGAYINRVPLDKELNHDLEAMEKRVHSGTKLVFVCNPNNPTGTIIDKERIKDFCDSLSKKAVVFSDEAYYDYVTEPGYPSMVSLIKEGSNVIVSRTFSKVYGLAGLRIGYIMSRPDIADRIRPNVMAATNILAVAAARAALEDREFYEYSLDKNNEAREFIYSTLDDLNLKYMRSHTNFVFFHTGMPISSLIEKMRAKNVWIGRPFPPLTEWCRISTGSMSDVQKFGKALTEVMT